MNSELDGAERSLGCLVHLVRHAHAMAREHWNEDDELRPLSALGRAQAEALADRLAPLAPRRVVSSPALRCVMTVTPTAERVGVEVEDATFLAEGSGAQEAIAGLLALAAEDPIVACTHGDVLGLVLDHLAREGVELASPRLIPKAGTWELLVSEAQVRSARFVPAPTA